METSRLSRRVPAAMTFWIKCEMKIFQLRLIGLSYLVTRCSVSDLMGKRISVAHLQTQILGPSLLEGSGSDVVLS